jgi:hypothetical protein
MSRARMRSSRVLKGSTGPMKRRLGGVGEEGTSKSVHESQYESEDAGLGGELGVAVVVCFVAVFHVCGESRGRLLLDVETEDVLDVLVVEDDGDDSPQQALLANFGVESLVEEAPLW